MNCSARRPCFIDHPFLTSDFRQIPRRIFLNFSHSLSTAAFAAGIFIAWGIGKFCEPSCSAVMIFSPFPAIWSWRWCGIELPVRSLVDSSASRIHASLVLILLDAPFPQFFHNFAGHSRSHWSFQLLTRVLDGFFEFRYPRGRWNRFLAIFVHYRVSAFHVTTFASPSAGHFFPISSRVLAITDLAWMSAAFLSVSPRTTCIRQEVFLPME